MITDTQIGDKVALALEAAAKPVSCEPVCTPSAEPQHETRKWVRAKMGSFVAGNLMALVVLGIVSGLALLSRGERLGILPLGVGVLIGALVVGASRAFSIDRQSREILCARRLFGWELQRIVYPFEDISKVSLSGTYRMGGRWEYHIMCYLNEGRLIPVSENGSDFAAMQKAAREMSLTVRSRLLDYRCGKLLRVIKSMDGRRSLRQLPFDWVLHYFLPCVLMAIIWSLSAVLCYWLCR